MPAAQPDFFGLVDDTSPRGTDSRTISDDQHRNILSSLRQQCPNWTGEVSATHGDVNTLSGVIAAGVKPMLGAGGVTVLYAYNADTPPVGWTVEEPDTNLRNLVIGPQAGGGAIGGTMDPTSMTDASISVAYPASTQGHGLNASENGPHGHTGVTSTDGFHSHLENVSGSPGAGAALIDNGNSGAQTSTGGDGNHSHTVSLNQSGNGTPHSHDIGGSTTASATMTPRYARGILMKLAP